MKYIIVCKMKSRNKVLIIMMLLCGLLNVFGGTGVFAATCGGADTSIIECDEGGTGAIWHILLLIIDIMTIGVGVLGLIGILVFGVQYLTAGGDVSKTTKAKSRMLQIVIGLIVFVALWAGSQWLLPGGLFEGPGVVKKIEFGQKTLELDAGDTMKVPIEIDGDDKSFSLISSDSSIAMAYASGAVHCLKEGKATITAIAVDGQKASAEVSCKKKVEPKPDDGGGDDGGDGGGDGGGEIISSERVYELRTGRQFQYWISVPKNATSGMPLVIFLHGDGESGSPYALEANSTYVPMVKYLVNGNKSNSYIALIPVLPRYGARWTDSPSALKSLIDGVVSEYKINKNRIYIIGFSRGATGLWKMVNDYPNFFAAAVPVSNYPQFGESALNFRHTKIWGVAGEYETTPGWNVRDGMSDFINNINHGGGSAKMEVYPGQTHNTISGALRNSELVEWLLKQ